MKSWNLSKLTREDRLNIRIINRITMKMGESYNLNQSLNAGLPSYNYQKTHVDFFQQTKFKCFKGDIIFPLNYPTSKGELWLRFD